MRPRSLAQALCVSGGKSLAHSSVITSRMTPVMIWGQREEEGVNAWALGPGPPAPCGPQQARYPAFGHGESS